MNRYGTSISLAVWNIACLSLVFFGWSYGLITPIFLNDVTHITWIIAAIMAFVLVFTTIQTFQLDHMSGSVDRDLYIEPAYLAGKSAFIHFIKNEVLVILGICGTLIGILMVTSVDPSASIEARIAASTAGLHTGVSASLVGLASKLWCETIFFIKSKRLRSLGWF